MQVSNYFVNSFYSACTIQSQKGTRFESSMWKKKKFFLHIKKFLYTHEKDEYNDVNKHIFEKMY